MCQLLALNSNNPTDINFSFEGFMQRSGITDNNVDGVGIAFFDGNSIRLYKDDNPGYSSYVRDIVKIYRLKSYNVVAHIRRASKGKSSLFNTHPFVRNLWNENWVFAHNGHIHTMPNDFKDVEYQVAGETDSESFFVYLINKLQNTYNTKPSNEEIFNFISNLVDNFHDKGILNFTLSNGSFLIIHCSTNLYWITRKAPFKRTQRIDDGGVIELDKFSKPTDITTIVATLPITANEQWNKLINGQSIMFIDGLIAGIHNGTPSIIDKDLESKIGIQSGVNYTQQFLKIEKEHHDYFFEQNKEEMEKSEVNYN